MIAFSDAGPAAMFDCDCDVQSLINELAGLLDDWSVRFSAMVQIAAGFETETRLVIDGAPRHSLSWEDDGRWLGSHGEAIVALDDSEHTISVEMRSSTAAQTASIKEIALVARMLKQ
jgi:hypothetical protein